MDIESSAIDFLEGKPVQKGNRGEHVSVHVVDREVDDFAAAVNAGDKDSMSFMRKALFDRAEHAEEQMMVLADFKGDTMFRYKATELFKYVKYACDHELKDIFMIASKDSALSEIDVENIRILSDTYTAKEKEKNDALIDAQEKFAYKYNMEIK